MVIDILWERWGRFWLPAEERTGNTRTDLGRALSRAYPNLDPNKTERRLMSGYLLIEETRTVAAIAAAPAQDLPDWVSWQHEPNMNFRPLVKTLPRADVLLGFGKANIDMACLRASTGDVLAICEAGKPVTTIRRAVVEKLAQRSRKALDKLPRIKALASQCLLSPAVGDHARKDLLALGEDLNLDHKGLRAICDLSWNATTTEIWSAKEIIKERKTDARRKQA